MNSPILAWLLENYHWRLSLLTGVAIFAATFVFNQLLMLVPTFKGAHRLNQDTYQAKMKKPVYAANQKWNRKWASLYLLVIFGLVMPFCLTLDPQPWWRVLRDIVVILLFYDFFYYLTHRFAFHHNGVTGGPLVWMHAVHHQQHNPCRMDSSYIHPLEVAIGLGLYVASIFVLSRFMGEFHVATIVITWIAFSWINLHNHDLWTVDRFPFKYLSYAAKMHHHHHAKFTGGNYATITLFYDWLFGTLDHGQGHKALAQAQAKAKAKV
jgi:sterol desaturase/sphingolipid hydroxylase (fatty acid hydroxylase superfamily)